MYLVWTHTTKKKKQQKQENKNLKIDVDVGMKKAQKQEMIQDARRFGVLYPSLHSTSKYISHPKNLLLCMYLLVECRDG